MAINGSSGSISFNGNTFCVTNWTLNGEATEIDVTTTCNAGAYSGIVGTTKFSGSATGFWDTSAMPTASAGLNIRPGVTATMTLAIGASAKSFSFSATITKIAIGNPVNGAISFDFEFFASSTITYPV